MVVTQPRTSPGAVGLLAAAAVAGGVNLVASLAGWTVAARVSVWLVMPLLGLWALAAAPQPRPRPVTLLVVGAGFAWGGDVLLSLPGELWFPLGMASFAAMQVLYVAAFRAIPGPGLVRAWPIAWVPYVAVWLGMNALVWSGAGVLRIPVLVYSALLIVMAVQALDMVLRVPRPAGWSVAWGGVLFVVSDGLIALREFAGVLPGGAPTSFAIMLTYLAAQALIVTGFVRAVRALSPPTRSPSSG